jgi:XTP/dITP diphosphohydrolase
MIPLWVATTNPGKILEFRNILHGIAEVHSLSELKVYTPPPETGASFEENARIKAKSLRAVLSEHWIVADDSGLEVEGLGGLPGIHSARYAGEHARDSENVAKLLKMLKIRSPNQRAAQFRCVLVAYSPAGQERVVEGVVKGQISQKVSGTSGFGYDPIFVPENENKTFAELGPAFKNRVSHRAQAIRELVPFLQSNPTVSR